jgi:hypothetical protein
MAILEAQLETWSHQGPTSQFTATYDTLRTVLYDTGSPYAHRGFNVFLQGSYKNDTNVYGDSDVDVVICTDDVYYSDVSSLTDEDRRAYEAGWVRAEYQLENFKQDVTSWLIKKYGSALKVGTKALYIEGNGPRRNADVVVAAQFRRYSKFRSDLDKELETGICFFLPNGTRIENFPKQHLASCTTKNQATNWFKRTVRTFKNLRNNLIERGVMQDGVAPSYFLEGLLYNVPIERFGGSYSANFNDTLNWLVQADRSKFVCANDLFYLFHPFSPVTWRVENCVTFLNAVVRQRDNW